MANSAEKVSELIKDAVASHGIELWDVRFVKEGASWYLRVYIDKPEGITIDDCSDISHTIDPIIDEADPIDVSYYLEVCSPGLERELVKPEHFKKYINSTIKVKLYKAENGIKEFTGILKSYEDVMIIEVDGEQHAFELKNISKANLCDM